VRDHSAAVICFVQNVG